MLNHFQLFGMQMLTAIGLIFAMTLNAHAQTPTELQELQFSSDIDSTLPGTGGATTQILDDDSITMFDLSLGTADATGFFNGLDNADVDAYHNSDACGPRLFSLDASAEINGTVMRPGDVFATNGSKILDAQAEGIPDNVNVDAVSRSIDNCDIVFSIDIDAEISGVAYRPSDLIAWNDSAGFSLFRTLGLQQNVDALHILGGGRLLLSVDTDLSILGNAFQDEDVIEVIPGGPGAFFELSFSPSPFDASWQPADLDALWALPAPQAGVFQWASADVEVFENAGSVSVTVQRIDGSEGAIDVSWSTLADSATDGADYTGDSDILTLTDGMTSGVVTINLLDDALVEGTEEFSIRIDAVSGTGGIGNPREVRVIIRDDEDFIFADGYES